MRPSILPVFRGFRLAAPQRSARVLPPIAARRWATSLPDSFSSSPLYEKLKSSPAVLDRVMALVKLFGERGITMDRQPTFQEMMTIARDPEIQAEMAGLKKSMDEAGVSLDIQELLKSMK